METVYELKDNRSPMKKAVPFLVAAAAFAVAFLFLGGGVVKWVMLGMAVVSLGVFAANYLMTDSPVVVLTNDSVIAKGKGTERKVTFAEMSKAELTFQENGSTKRIDFFAADSFQADEKSMLYITDSKNRRVEVAAANYEVADFRSFLDVFQSMGNNGRMASASKVDELVKQNENYLKEDNKLRLNLQNTLLDAYKALYIPRGDYFLREKADAKVVYKYQKNPNESAVFFIDGDYAEGLEETNIEAGKNLIEASTRNLALVDTRIEGYRAIGEKLRKMKSLDEATNKMRNVAGQLETLQNNNQNAQDNSHELALQAETLKQLQVLTEEMHSVDDLDKSLVLKERVALME